MLSLWFFCQSISLTEKQVEVWLQWNWPRCSLYFAFTCDGIGMLSFLAGILKHIELTLAIFSIWVSVLSIVPLKPSDKGRESESFTLISRTFAIDGGIILLLLLTLPHFEPESSANSRVVLCSPFLLTLAYYLTLFFCHRFLCF